MKEFSNVFDERGERRICSDSAEPEKQRMQFNVYFLGIGGIGMSALARYFLHEGRKVAGYDRVQSHLTDQIEVEGAVVHYEEDPSQIPADFRDPAATIVVYTPAVPADHAELRWFRQNGFEIVKRSQMLGREQFIEPDVDIPYDTYRSFNRGKRSGKQSSQENTTSK